MHVFIIYFRIFTMPGKKKRRKTEEYADTPLLEKYSQLPDLPDQLKKGHVLLQFLLLQKNASATAKLLKSRGLIIEANGQDMRLRVSHLPRSTTQKFKNRHNNAGELERFLEACEEHFVCPLKLGQAELPSAAAPKSTDHILPEAPPTSPMKTRRKCDGCRSLRGRLMSSNLKLREERRAHQTNIAALKKQLKPIKQLNQTIKRQKEIITHLREKLSKTEKSTASAAKEVKKSEAKKFEEKLKSAKEKLEQQKKEIVKTYKSARKDLSDQFGEQLASALETLEEDTSCISLTRSSRAFEWNIRCLVYSCILCNVATGQVATLLKHICKILNITVDPAAFPSRSTIQQMALEIGTWSDIQACELLFDNSNITLGFDATTQEGIHVNVIYMTVGEKCYVLSLEQLPGGTAHDYSSHFMRTICHLADIYSMFHDLSVNEVKKKMCNNISTIMSD
jgi:hypothetical protein